MNYLDKGEYFTKDIYNKAPFIFQPDVSQPQLLNQLIGITILNTKQFELEISFTEKTAITQNYSDISTQDVEVNIGEFKKIYRFNESISLPFLNGTFRLRDSNDPQINKTIFLKFSGFDGVVEDYKENIKIEPLGKSSSVLKLSLSGTNKSKIVDYLNTTVAVLSRTELERKNLYATKTITFIDSSLQAVGANLNKFTTDLNAFRQTNKVFDIDAEMLEINERIKTYEATIEADDLKLTYLNALEGYLNNKTDYSEIAAPSSVGLEEGGISSGVTNITALAIERKNLEYTTQASSPLFLDIDRKIEAEKKVLLETLKTTRALIQVNSNRIRKSIAIYESKLGRLPEDQQEFLRLQRQMELSQEAYNVYLAKRSEAAIVKAANVSDIVVIDSAKDIGGGRIGPNMSLNYMAAIIGGGALPMLIIIILFLLDTHIRDAEQVERLSKIPVLGVIGKNKYQSSLVLIDHKKSVIAESFRAIRSSLQFIYKRKLQEAGGKTLMVTSSVSGEGKTFTAMNMATAYAISGKKTILLGLDLRKPKIFEDFKLSNDKGVVNYLVGDATKDEVINTTHVQGLDVMLSGPVPPNPAELLMSDAMDDLIKELRSIYDVIILDTPPLGLVSDAMELTQYADATLYMVRLNYSKRGMLSIINNKYAKGEVEEYSLCIKLLQA